MIRTVVALAVGAALFISTAPAALADAAMRAVRGAVAPGEAVPPDAEAVVRLRGKDGVVVAEDRVRSEGREALPFEVWIPAGSSGTLEATLEGDDVTGRSIDPVEVPPGTGPVDLGEIAMMPAAEAAAPAAEPANEAAAPDPALAEAEVREVEAEAEAAEVAAEAAEDAEAAEVEAESEPEAAEVEAEAAEVEAEAAEIEAEAAAVEAEAEPEAAEVEAATQQAVDTAADENDRFRAIGREPGWVLELDGQNLVLVPAPDAEPIVAKVAPQVDDQGRLTYRLEDADIAVALDAAVCRDETSGIPHPVTVTVTTPDGTFEGCGGEPYALLAGGEWQSPARSAVAQTAEPDAAVTLDFLADGRLVGSTGCNPYEAPVTATSERLAIGPVSIEEAACPDETLAATERRFIEALESATRFDVAPGELTLIADDRPVLVARR